MSAEALYPGVSAPAENDLEDGLSQLGIPASPISPVSQVPSFREDSQGEEPLTQAQVGSLMAKGDPSDLEGEG